MGEQRKGAFGILDRIDREIVDSRSWVLPFGTSEGSLVTSALEVRHSITLLGGDHVDLHVDM